MTVWIVTGYWSTGFYRHILGVTTSKEAADAIVTQLLKRTDRNRWERFETTKHEVTA